MFYRSECVKNSMIPRRKTYDYWQARRTWGTCFANDFAYNIGGLRRNPLGSIEVREYSRFLYLCEGGRQNGKDLACLC